MEPMVSDNNLVCVLFPGIVKDEEKAIECLGGIKNISEAISNKKRLGLSFQPNNAYVKKISADAKKAGGVLLKVKVKKTRVDGQVKKEVISTDVVGTVTRIYKFDALCDFQYLPVEANPTTKKVECIYESLVPTGLDTPEFLLRDSIQPFIAPAYFTRQDKGFNYRYTEKKSGLTTGEEVLMKGMSNQQPHYFNFNLIDELPTEPGKFYIERLNAKIKLTPAIAVDVATVKKMFEERPGWTLNALNYMSKIKKDTLRLILPTLAAFMSCCPWRKVWLKFGYDPRKDPGARFYQTLDFRVRQTAGVNAMVTRLAEHERHKKADRRWQWHEEPEAAEPEVVAEGSVIFRPGVQLTQRQVIYQYCDIKLPEVSALLSAPPPPGLLCHAVRGWLAPGVDAACRDHIFRYAKQTLLAGHTHDLKLEQPSSDEEQHSDDEEAEENKNVRDEEASTSNYPNESLNT